MHKLLMAFGLAMAAQVASSAPITYDVSQVITLISHTVDVNGFITTDGAIGALATADVTNFSLSLVDSNGISSNTLNPSNSVVTVNGGVLASLTQLSLEINNTVNDAIGFALSSGGSGYFVEVPLADQMFEVAEVADTASPANMRVTSPFVFATVAPDATDAVPEPGSIALLFAGAGASLAAARRRRRVS
jgi:hypothetical protein